MAHDAASFIRDLGARLASRSRHVCLVLGAGTAKAGGLPDVGELIEIVLRALEPEPRAAFAFQLRNRSLEEGLSRVRALSNLLSADQELDGLSATSARSLDRLVCNAIVAALDISSADLGAAQALAMWIRRTDYARPLEVFCLNYDLILEAAFESARLTYFDGFVGALNSPFFEELVDPDPPRHTGLPPGFARLWKLHGSVNWYRDVHGQILRSGSPIEGDLPVAIYPSDLKYEESRRAPFLVLHDRFRRALSEPETLTLVSGYSFGDSHINEVIFEAAARRERSEIVAFIYSDIPEALGERASSTPNLQVVGRAEAILGGIRSEWTPPTITANLYWTDGKFALPDFRRLALYLARSSSSERADAVLDALVARLMPTQDLLAATKHEEALDRSAQGADGDATS